MKTMEPNINAVCIVYLYVSIRLKKRSKFTCTKLKNVATFAN